MSRVLAVASGKGGTGKTSVSVNLSLALGRAGRKVCLLDADLGLSNVDVLLGISPQTTLEHVLFEGVPMERAVFPAGPNLDVVPGGSGVTRLADLSREGRVLLAREFSKLSGYDFLVVDGSPGVSSQVISMCLACPELAVVVNPDPSSITDAYALVKVLAENGMRRSPYLVLNRVRSGREAREIFERLRAAMGKYLKIDARLLGHIPHDPHMAAAAARQRALVELFPASAAGRAMLSLAKSLDEARLPAGTASADPAEVMSGALVRMRESSPTGAARLDRARETLDAAVRLAGLVGRPEAAGQDQVGRRLQSLLAEARECLGGPPARGEALREARPVRVAVVSSDAAIGEILAESLVSSGMHVNGGGRPQAAVVYWSGDAQALEARLAALGGVPWAFVRGVAGRETPRLRVPPAEVLDMPFKLEDLAGVARRLAGKGRETRFFPPRASTRA